MTTTSLSIDKDIRDLAARRAKVDKLSLSAIARMLLRDYGEGRISIGSSFSRSESYYTEVVEVDTDIQQQMDHIGTLWNHKSTVGK